MRHQLRMGFILLAAVGLLLGAFATTAYANLDDEPTDGMHAFSGSNPGAGEDYWWRQGWGRSLTPDFAFTPPEGMDYKFDGYIIGMLYSVDRSAVGEATGTVANSIIDTATPENYYLSTFGGTTNNTGPYGTNEDNTVDMLGIFANPPGGFWPPSGLANPVEGQWFFHYRYFSTFRYSDNVHTIAFGIDTTEPNAVDGLTLRTGLYTPPVTGWQPQKRMHVSWTPAQYDALSGVGYYEVLIDDKPFLPEATSTPKPEQGRVYAAPWLPTPSSITIENMPPGKHKVSVITVDRATNRSVAATSTYYSDPDTPTVAFTSPLNGFLKSTTQISVKAEDLAGYPGVKVALDGTNVATFTAPPYTFKPNLTGVLPGPHVLTATATDMLGRSVTTTLAVSTLGAVVVPTDGFIVTDDESLNATTTGTTTTNPNDPSSQDSFWRQGWGNSLNPQFQIEPATADPIEFGFTTGLLYTVNRTPDVAIDPSKPDNYSKSSLAEGTVFTKTVDLLGIFVESAPVGGWPASSLGGEAQPYEGMWYFNFLPFTTKGYVPQNTNQVAFGIDVTDPFAVAGLQASPSLDASAANRWTAASRAHVTWLADRYDDLSGVAYYKVLVDDKVVTPEGSSGGRIYEVIGRTPSSLTIEDMPPGKHKISIIAVDRATNEGPAASTYFYSDPDAPKIQLISPSATIIQVKPSLVASASDIGGVKNVIFRLDGVPIGTVTTPGSDKVSYSHTPDLSSFAAGTHVLSATVTDMLGRTTAVSKNVTLDKTPVRVTSFSRTPSIFYPLKRDGYYDNSTIKYTLNKTAAVTLRIRDSGGTTRKTFTATKNAGSNSFTWDGKWSSDGKVHIGSSGSSTYYYQITAVDSAGYTVTTSKISTTMRNYQLVKTGSNTVKVVKR